jgi:hypothetical protein
MRISVVGCTLIASLTVTTLGGCSGTGPQVPMTASAGAVQSAGAGHLPKPSAEMIAMTTREHILPGPQRLVTKSWMSPAAKHTQYLLYVSDQPAGTVDVFAYKSKKGHLLGQLAGFQFPYGECLDSASNVYITDFAAAQILEFAHGGTTPIKTLSDTYGYPIGCSVDPTTGNLAVANFEGNQTTCMGGIVVYAGASGDGTLYQDKDFNYYWPPGYDSQGNLYVEGKKKYNHGKTGVAMLAAGGSTLATLTLSGGTISYPGGMMWDGHYMTATDQAYQGGHTSGIYRLTASGSAGQIIGATELTDGCMKGSVAYNDVVQPWVNGTARPDHAVVAGNLACTYRYPFWNYIKGGDPKRTLPYNLSPQLAYGQTVSDMKR